MIKINLKLSNLQTAPLEHFGVQCNECGDVIFSRARHDFNSCSCGKSHIDGGFDYTKVSWGTANPPAHVKLTLLGATKQDLYNDWNYSGNLFGVVLKKDLVGLQEV
jgi:hypothetical protein